MAKESKLERELTAKGYETVALATKHMIENNEILEQLRQRGYYARAVKQPGSAFYSVMTKRSGRMVGEAPKRIKRRGWTGYWNRRAGTYNSRSAADDAAKQLYAGRGSVRGWPEAVVIQHDYTVRNYYNPDMAGPGYAEWIENNPTSDRTSWFIYTRGKPKRGWPKR